MMAEPHILFISDLHLNPKSPAALTKAFFNFLAGPCRQAEALYVLGDLFETWVGDDDIPSTFNRKVVNAFKELTDSGVKLYVMHGNRDFLMGKEFAAATGAEMLGDTVEVDLYGTRTLLTHGDLLCTEDTAYQAYRKQVRTSAWQNQVLALPLKERHLMAKTALEQSDSAKKGKTMEIMDVSTEAVLSLLRRHDFPRLIHGHTHRPARHVYNLEDQRAERWVLTDWNAQRMGYLYCDRHGCRAIAL